MDKPKILIGLIILEICMSILYFIFSLLTLFVIVYYIRRRYKLYREIKRIPQDLLYKESYRNHLKNLRLRCTIHNFIIFVLILEFLRTIGNAILYSLFLLEDFENESTVVYNFASYLFLYIFPLLYSFIPVLSLMMNFLWLAYRKYEYKNTLIQWAWYIGIRVLVQILLNMIHGSDVYTREITVFVSLLYGSITIFDYLQYIYYSRKFYLHLKSREKEIRLFYFDNKAYLDIKFIRFHLKIATILVAIALFFYTLAMSNTAYLEAFVYACTLTRKNYCHGVNTSLINISNFLQRISRFCYTVLFTFNYIYMFIVIVHKSYKDKQKLANINKYIKPIVKQYHDKFSNRCSNYS